MSPGSLSSMIDLQSDQTRSSRGARCRWCGVTGSVSLTSWWNVIIISSQDHGIHWSYPRPELLLLTKLDPNEIYMKLMWSWMWSCSSGEGTVDVHTGTPIWNTSSRPIYLYTQTCISIDRACIYIRMYTHTHTHYLMQSMTHTHTYNKLYGQKH